MEAYICKSFVSFSNIIVAYEPPNEPDALTIWDVINLQYIRTRPGRGRTQVCARMHGSKVKMAAPSRCWEVKIMLKEITAIKYRQGIRAKRRWDWKKSPKALTNVEVLNNKWECDIALFVESSWFTLLNLEQRKKVFETISTERNDGRRRASYDTKIRGRWLRENPMDVWDI